MHFSSNALWLGRLNYGSKLISFCGKEVIFKQTEKSLTQDKIFYQLLNCFMYLKNVIFSLPRVF